VGTKPKKGLGAEIVVLEGELLYSDAEPEVEGLLIAWVSQGTAGKCRACMGCMK